MEDKTLVQSSFSGTINAPIEKVDIPSWCFGLPESEYQACSPAHCSAGSTTTPVIWDLTVRKIDDKTCEFTNTVQSCATPELMEFLGKQGIPLEVFRVARKPISEAHNRRETPLFAKSIERHDALRQG